MTSFNNWHPTGNVDTTFTGRRGGTRTVSSAALKGLPVTVEYSGSEQTIFTRDDGTIDVDLISDFGLTEFRLSDSIYLEVYWNNRESHARLPLQSVDETSFPCAGQ